MGAVLFSISFYAATVLILVAAIPLFLGPRRWIIAALQLHGRVSVWLLKAIVGTRMEVRGHANLPPGPVLVAAKHQSAWDTFALTFLMRDPALVMKRELFWIPLYGWFSARMGMIGVRRAEGPAALRRMARDAQHRAGENREVLIFAEGTRRAPGAPPAYKPGVAHLYRALGVPCCPVALNSGLFWPRRSWKRYPGTIVVEFLEPIPPGLSRRDFMARLEAAIEPATDRLIAEAAAAPDAPPIPQAARERLEL